MNDTQRKRATRYRMGTTWHATDMADMFLLNKDDQVLIDRINNDDESALLQFTIKHLDILIGDIIRSKSYNGIERDVMDLYLPLFFEQVKLFAKTMAGKPLPEDWEFTGQYIKPLQVSYELTQPLIDEKYKHWKDFEITDKHVDFLNDLNAFLTKTEEEIVARAKIDLSTLEARIKDDSVTTSDYEYFVDIQYATEASNGDPIYTASHSFGLHNIEENRWGLLCDEDDWRERGWLPTLKTRCCYLMHELVYHAGLAHYIFDINDIWIETKTWDQQFISLKSGFWETVK